MLPFTNPEGQAGGCCYWDDKCVDSLGNSEDAFTGTRLA